MAKKKSKPGDAFAERSKDPALGYAHPEAYRAWNMATSLLLMADWLSDETLPAANRKALLKKLARVELAYQDIDPHRMDALRKVMIDALDFACGQPERRAEAARIYLERAIGEARCKKVEDSVLRRAVEMWPTRKHGRTKAIYDLAIVLGCAPEDADSLRIQLAAIRRTKP